jgi:2-hydroxy-6-oxonona-2,4-dienedioate hydrolase
MRVNFVDLNGVRTRYLHAGNGHPVFLVHGVGMTADSWIKNIGPLSEHFSVYAPDLLGCGFTEGDSPPSMAPQVTMVQHFANLADHLKLQTFSVVGSSLGGLVAALAYFKMPGRIASLTLVGCASILAASKDDLREIFRASHKNGSRAFADNSLTGHRGRLANIVADVGCIPLEVLLMQVVAYALPWSQSAYERRLAGLIEHLDTSPAAWVGERLEQIHVPAMLIAGRNDPRTNAEWEGAAGRRLPHAEQTMLADCGHLPHLEHPTEFNAAVVQFISRHQCRSAA